ncbi:rod-binding protein [Roseomonas sp. OT10]|uniref:rod-binding protein n=1 Tax=Roseomonas cutis TaxID=2897332 RepID=UPI001E4A3C1E|nr:rod-binding protein [Roseomonas sp. OT10]UFN48827.1 rod-binding protein [Roseomonas sp. OT10]
MTTARILPPVSTAAATPAMRQAAERFEAQALGALLQPAFATLHADRGAFGGGHAEATWRPMLVDAYAQGWARQGGIGLADAVLREMLRTQSAAPGAHASSTTTGGDSPG